MVTVQVASLTTPLAHQYWFVREDDVVLFACAHDRDALRALQEISEYYWRETGAQQVYLVPPNVTLKDAIARAH